MGKKGNELRTAKKGGSTWNTVVLCSVFALILVLSAVVVSAFWSPAKVSFSLPSLSLTGRVVQSPELYVQEDFGACRSFAASGVYTLTGDIVVSQDTCLTVPGGQNIVIDCQGYNLNYSRAPSFMNWDWAVRLYKLGTTPRNVTIRNCKLNGFGAGVSIDEGSDILIENVQIRINASHTDDTGVYFYNDFDSDGQGDNVTLRNVVIDGATSYGIKGLWNDLHLNNVTIKNSGGIDMGSSSYLDAAGYALNFTVINSTFVNLSAGIYVAQLNQPFVQMIIEKNTFRNVSAIFSSLSVISLDGSSTAPATRQVYTIRNNVFNDVLLNAILVSYGFPNANISIMNNVINNSFYGVLISPYPFSWSQSTFVELRNNSFLNNWVGVGLTHTSNVTIANNTFTNNQFGISATLTRSQDSNDTNVILDDQTVSGVEGSFYFSPESSMYQHNDASVTIRDAMSFTSPTDIGGEVVAAANIVYFDNIATNPFKGKNVSAVFMNVSVNALDLLGGGVLNGTGWVRCPSCATSIDQSTRTLTVNLSNSAFTAIGPYYNRTVTVNSQNLTLVVWFNATGVAGGSDTLYIPLKGQSDANLQNAAYNISGISLNLTRRNADGRSAIVVVVIPDALNSLAFDTVANNRAAGTPQFNGGTTFTTTNTLREVSLQTSQLAIPFLSRNSEKAYFFSDLSGKVRYAMLKSGGKAWSDASGKTSPLTGTSLGTQSIYVFVNDSEENVTFVKLQNGRSGSAAYSRETLVYPTDAVMVVREENVDFRHLTFFDGGGWDDLAGQSVQDIVVQGPISTFVLPVIERWSYPPPDVELAENPECGDGSINVAGEQCELPDVYAYQVTEWNETSPTCAKYGQTGTLTSCSASCTAVCTNFYSGSGGVYAEPNRYVSVILEYPVTLNKKNTYIIPERYAMNNPSLGPMQVNVTQSNRAALNITKVTCEPRLGGEVNKTILLFNYSNRNCVTGVCGKYGTSTCDGKIVHYYLDRTSKRVEVLWEVPENNLMFDTVEGNINLTNTTNSTSANITMNGFPDVWENYDWENASSQINKSWRVHVSPLVVVPGPDETLLRCGADVGNFITYNNFNNPYIRFTGSISASESSCVRVAPDDFGGNNNITLDLQEYNITGAGSGVAINVSGVENVTIKNGTIEDFRIGILMFPDEDITYSDLTFVNVDIPVAESHAGAPGLSNVRAAEIASTTARIAWNTSETANASINYGTTTAVGTRVVNASWGRGQSISLSNLSMNVRYYFNVSSCDVDGNCNSSGQFNFTTRIGCGDVLNGSASLPYNVSGSGECLALTDDTVLNCNNNWVRGTGSSGTGIVIAGMRNVTVQNCQIASFALGMSVVNSTEVVAINNSFTNNVKGGLSVHGTSFDELNVSIGTSNTVDGNPINISRGVSGVVLSASFLSNMGYFGCLNCKALTLQHFTVTRAGQGLLLVNVTNLTINNATFINNTDGLYLFGANNVTISNVTFRDNTNSLYVQDGFNVSVSQTVAMPNVVFESTQYGKVVFSKNITFGAFTSVQDRRLSIISLVAQGLQNVLYRVSEGITGLAVGMTGFATSITGFAGHDLAIQDTSIASCQTISSSGAYVVANNLSTTGTCITINAANVVLNGAGKSLTGDTGTNDYGVLINEGMSNVTIANFGNIKDFGKAIYYGGSGEGGGFVVRNNTINSSKYGIVLSPAVNGSVTRNYVSISGSSSADAVDIGWSRNMTVANNRIVTAGGGGVGVRMSEPGVSRVENNTITLNGANGRGIEVNDAVNSTIKNNTIVSTQTSAIGIYLYNTLGVIDARNNVTSNTITLSGIGSTGAYFKLSINNVFVQNAFSVSLGRTLDFSLTATRSELANTIGTTNTERGMPILFSHTNAGGQSVTVQNSAAYGAVYVSGYDNVLIRNVTLTKAGIFLQNVVAGVIDSSVLTTTSTGMYLTRHANKINISGNRIVTSGQSGYGVHVDNSDAARLISNNITTTGAGAHGLYLEDLSGGAVNSNNITTQGVGAYGILGDVSSDRNSLASNRVTTQGVNASGIVLNKADMNTVTSNRVSTSGAGAHGVFTQSSSGDCARSAADNNLTSNTIVVAANNTYGIYLHCSSEMSVANNVIVASGVNGYGVYSSWSGENTYTGNAINSSGYAFMVPYSGNGVFFYFNHTVGAGNTYFGKQIIGRNNVSTSIANVADVGQIILLNTQGVVIRNVSGVGGGILLSNADRITIAGVNVSTNSSGVHGVYGISNSRYIKIENSTVKTYARASDAVRLEDFFNTVKNVTLQTSGDQSRGIFLSAGDNNVSRAYITTQGVKSYGVMMQGQSSRNNISFGSVNAVNSPEVVYNYSDWTSNSPKFNNVWLGNNINFSATVLNVVMIDVNVSGPVDPLGARNLSTYLVLSDPQYSASTQLGGSVIFNTSTPNIDASSAAWYVYVDGAWSRVDGSSMSGARASFATYTAESPPVILGLFANITSAPIVTFRSPTPSNTAWVNTTEFTVNVSLDQYGSAVRLEFNGTNYSMSGSGASWMYTVTGLDSLTYSYKVFANNSYGNTGVSATRTVRINITGPAINFVDPTPENGGTVEANSIFVNVSTDAVDTIKLEWNGVNGSLNGSGTKWWKNKTGLASGSYTFTVHANNSLGRRGRSGTRTVTVDLPTPVITFVDPTPDNGSTVSTNYVFVNVSLDIPATNVKLEFNRTNYSMSGSGTRWYRNHSVNSSTYTYKVFATTSLGEVGVSEKQTVTVQYYGFVSFTRRATIADAFVLGSNAVTVRSRNYSQFNKSATITLRGLSFIDPSIQVDAADSGSWVACSSSLCTKQSYAGGVLVFNVSHFTSYKGSEPGLTEDECNDCTGGGGDPADPPIVLPPVVDGVNDTVVNDIVDDDVFVNDTRPGRPDGGFATGINVDFVGTPGVACAQTTRKSSGGIVIGKAEIGKDIALPPGYEIVSEPLRVNCNGNKVDVTLNLPDSYEDLRALRCSAGTCTRVQDVSQNSLSLSCAGGSTSQAGLSSAGQSGIIAPDEFDVVVREEEPITAEHHVVEKGGVTFTFLESLPAGLKGGFSSPSSSVSRPENDNLRIVGTPIELSLSAPVQSAVNVSLPFTRVSGIENNSFAVYVQKGGKWEFIGGTINGSTVTASVNDISTYLSAENTALFSVVGVLCESCNRTMLTMEYDGLGSRRAMVLVHGLFSNTATFREMIDEFAFTRQPWQVWSFNYDTSKPVELTGKEFADALERRASEFDEVYVVAHSLGGLITQEALYQSFVARQGDSAVYSFLPKVKTAILIGTPNEGSPAIEVYKNLFTALANEDVSGKVFALSPKLLAQLKNGHEVPRVPTVEYVVIAGTKPYNFNVGLFNVSASVLLGFKEKNDGILTVTSASTIGGELVNTLCTNYYELSLTHTDLHEKPIVFRVVERLLSEKLRAQGVEALAGFNQYFSMRVSACSPDDTYVIIGKPLVKGAEYDPTGCSCGNGVCGVGEDDLSCPEDCTSFILPGSSKLAGLAYASLVLLFLSILVGFVVVAQDYRLEMNWKWLLGRLYNKYGYFVLSWKQVHTTVIGMFALTLLVFVVRWWLGGGVGVVLGLSFVIGAVLTLIVHVLSINRAQSPEQVVWLAMQANMAQGFTIDQVGRALVARGWPLLLVQRVAMHARVHESLVRSIEQNLAKGFSERQVKNALLSAGWDKFSVLTALEAATHTKYYNLSAHSSSGSGSSANQRTVSGQQVGSQTANVYGGGPQGAAVQGGSSQSTTSGQSYYSQGSNPGNQ